MKHSKRGGFTLVELLIVIVVLGVLAAMMMLSSSAAVSSAKASNIIAGLTTFKKALTHFYIDNHEKFVKQKDGSYIFKNLRTKSGSEVANLGALMQNAPELVTKYIGNSSQFKFDKNNYHGAATSGTWRFEDNGGANKRNAWFVGYTLSDAEIASGVNEKLVARTPSLKLLHNQGTIGVNSDGKTSGNSVKQEIKPYDGGQIVWLKVLDLE